MALFSIRTRLIVLFAVLLCLFFASSLYVTRELSQNADMMVEESRLVTLVKNANSANRYYGELKYWLSDFAASLLMHSEREANAAHRALEEQLSAIEPYEPNLVASIRADVDEMVRYAYQAVDAHTKNERVLGNSLMAKAHIFIKSIDQHLGTIVSKAEADAQQRARTTYANAVRTNKIVATIFTACAVIGLFVTILILRSITRPLDQLDKAVSSIANGNLDTLIPAPGSDEIGKMAGTLEMFRQSLVERNRLAHEHAQAELALAESEDRYLSLSEASFEGLLVHDNGQIIDANSRLQHMFGYDLDELVGMSAFALIAPKEQAAARKNVADGKETPYETVGLRKDATTFSMEIKGRYMKYRGTRVRVAACNDITERKKSEDDRNAALAEAERANRAKSEFLATMSHEFRTPLNAILGFSELMCAQYFGELGSDNYNEYANDIHRSGKHMLALVNDVLDISAIEAGKREIDREKIDVESLLQNCFRSVETAANNNDVGLSLDVSDTLPILHADKRSITQVVLNLLSNAIKFTDQGGTIRIWATGSEQEIRIGVRDTGIGIPADKLPSITEPFSQSHTDPHKYQDGTGLGLSIVEALVASHEGKLSIESEVGEGTTVMVTLPIKEAEA